MNAPQHSIDNRNLERRARALYRESTHRIDPVTAGRLRAARRTALEATRTSRQTRGLHVLLPTGALAAVALAVLMAWSPMQNRGSDALQPQSVAARVADSDMDLPPDPDSGDPSMYQNLDFYGWLASNNTSSPGNR
ncbi:hypothetical protein [Dyella sp.]|uniref:hypothetical protein n=1 Tax=Dyella sp. TaxID=1869338 RepID=UPI002ED3B5F8